MSVTIKDIAKLAKVSHTTVSRALNNSPLINEKTKSKIKAIAEELNYVPNYSAKSLVLDKSYTIGLFFSSINIGTSSSFFYEIVKGVNSVIKENYNLVVKGIDDYKEFSGINRQRFDGIILMSQSDKDNEFIYHMREKEIPLIVLNREMEGNSLINILADDEQGAFKAVSFLIKNHHKDIAIIEGQEEFKSTKSRRNGFFKALINNNIPIRKEYMIKGRYDIKSGYEAMNKLLSLSNIPTAVFCFNDDMAIGAIKAIFEKGLSVPKDISIIGFDDIGFAEYATPSLTTIKRPLEEISVMGAEKMIDLIDKKDYKGEKVYIETELIVRESTCIPGKNHKSLKEK
ncbi:MAG: LacI family DNA-binding transcriptional regulator [Clostridium sp.]|uniref:LacI family DNA-binding transcriptional regulator n=1 Tax=Clostridium sp. TaxID=1506 RepID=UPI002914A7EF|nr:LacI family DNA-binding transcriptional regulator [Clostridium sp.]MDU5110694.1 LacI family DNA-binding transcriptional regulator [Clostridium sp.]